MLHSRSWLNRAGCTVAFLCALCCLQAQPAVEVSPRVRVSVQGDYLEVKEDTRPPTPTEEGDLVEAAREFEKGFFSLTDTPSPKTEKPEESVKDDLDVVLKRSSLGGNKRTRRNRFIPDAPEYTPLPIAVPVPRSVKNDDDEEQDEENQARSSGWKVSLPARPVVVTAEEQEGDSWEKMLLEGTSRPRAGSTRRSRFQNRAQAKANPYGLLPDEPPAPYDPNENLPVGRIVHVDEPLNLAIVWLDSRRLTVSGVLVCRNAVTLAPTAVLNASAYRSGRAVGMNYSGKPPQVGDEAVIPGNRLIAWMESVSDPSRGR